MTETVQARPHADQSVQSEWMRGAAEQETKQMPQPVGCGLGQARCMSTTALARPKDVGSPKKGGLEKGGLGFWTPVASQRFLVNLAEGNLPQTSD